MAGSDGKKAGKYPRFSDFNTHPAALEGEKISITQIVGREILITAYRVLEGKFQTEKCLMLQLELDGVQYVAFSGSRILRDQLVEYEARLPFFSTIKKINRFMTLT
jgi:hypothetical protein